MTKVKRAYNRYAQLKCERHQTAVAAGIIGWVTRCRNKAAREANRRQRAKELKTRIRVQELVLEDIKVNAPKTYFKTINNLGLDAISVPGKRCRTLLVSL